MRSCASWAEGSRITANRFKGVFFFENDATPREFSFDPVVPRWHDLIMITGASRHYSLDPLRKVNSQGNQLLLPTSDETQLLRGSEVRYRRLFESAKDGILILDAETGMVVEVNPFLVELLGFSHEMFLGKKVWELGFFKDLVANQGNFAELQQKEYLRYEDMALETSDGRRIEVEFVSNVYQVDHQKVIQCNIWNCAATSARCR